MLLVVLPMPEHRQMTSDCNVAFSCRIVAITSTSGLVFPSLITNGSLARLARVILGRPFPYYVPLYISLPLYKDQSTIIYRCEIVKKRTLVRDSSLVTCLHYQPPHTHHLHCILQLSRGPDHLAGEWHHLE
jgi:hypothetical protein